MENNKFCKVVICNSTDESRESHIRLVISGKSCECEQTQKHHVYKDLMEDEAHGR